MHEIKRKKRKNVCESNFDGRFLGELCLEIVQQFTSEGPMNCLGFLSTRFNSEGSPIYRISVVSFREQIFSFRKTVILLAFGSGMCEGVGYNSRHRIGHVDIQVGSCIYLSVIVCHDMCT